MSKEDVQGELESNPLPQKRFNEGAEEEIDGRERTLLEAAARLYADAEAAERDLANYRENKPNPDDFDPERAGSGAKNEPVRAEVGDDEDGTVDPADAKPADPDQGEPRKAGEVNVDVEE